MAVGHPSEVFIIDSFSHKLVDKWDVGEPVTCMDHLVFPDSGTLFAFGTSTGKVLMRIDWEEMPSSFECRKGITDVKFSSDGYYLIVACEDQFLYIFTNSSNSYFQFAPRE